MGPRFRRKVLHAIAFMATFAVVWLVAMPAFALNTSTSAPICDARGAITFAPPPQIQDEERSIDIPADCFTVDINPFDVKVAGQGHRAPPLDFSSSQEPVAQGAMPVLAVYFAERLPVPVAATFSLPSGVIQSVDRPPRS